MLAMSTTDPGPRLIAPTARLQGSFLEAMAEFAADTGAVMGRTLVGELAEYGERWHEPEVFAQYVAGVRADALPDTPRPPSTVPVTTLWWAAGDTFLGRIAVRHRLTPFLAELGGHIGCGVRPTARRLGHATAMLRGCLPYARALGIDPVLVTCDTTNTGSRRTIEACGGALEDERQGALRYWIRTDR